MRFEYLDHTADFKIKAYGKTLEEAFESTAMGAFNFITDIQKIKKAKEKKIQLEAKTLESLLYDFLSELIFLLDTESFLFCACKDLKITKGKGYTLECTALGDDYKKYETKGDLKAVTYSEMKIEQGWTITVVIDI